MLKSLEIKKFTVFAKASIEFSKGLNVIIGDNATGKSHLLKLGYSVMHLLSGHSNIQSSTLADKLYNVFKPNRIGHLNSYDSGNQRTQITVAMDLPETFQFSFAKNSTQVTIDQTISQTFSKKVPYSIA
jgi:predicted ATP-dependent endonuclease of OLD family